MKILAIKVAEELDNTFSAFSKLIAAFTKAQINEVPYQGSWTAGQVAQHIIKATAGIPDAQVEKASREFDKQVEPIQEIFMNMELKMQSPDFILPEEKSYERNELLKELDKNKAWLISIINCKPLDELCMDLELPGMGFLTRYEWMQFINFHVQRHTIQLQNILSMLNK